MAWYRIVEWTKYRCEFHDCGPVPGQSQSFFPNTYKLALIHTTGSNARTDDIDVELFENPNGLASADLFSSVTFSNVDLTETNASATPEAATFGLAGIILIALATISRAHKTVTPAP